MSKCSLYRQCKYYNTNNYTCNYQIDKTYCGYYKKMTGVLILLIFSIMIQVIDAETQSLGTFKQNECVGLKQICSNCSFVNISTVLYPNSSIALTNKQMTKVGTDYNYTFCSTDTIGAYIVNGFGDLDGKVTVWSYDFQVNGIGAELSAPQSLLYIILLFGLAIILFFTIWGAIIYPWRNPRDNEEYIVGINDMKYLKVVLWVFVYLEVLFITLIFRNLAGGYLAIEGTYSFFNIIYTILLIGLLPFFPLLIFYTIIIWVSDKKVQKAITRGIKVK